MPVPWRRTKPSRAWRLTLSFALPAYVLATSYLLVAGEAGLVALLAANGRVGTVVLSPSVRILDRARRYGRPPELASIHLAPRTSLGERRTYSDGRSGKVEACARMMVRWDGRS
jgi:hypothetical protein